MKKKRNSAVYIDGENIPAKKAELIMKEICKRGVIDQAKVYGIQKDRSTRAWSGVAKEGDLQDIRLYGGPAHNKVDQKIKKDIALDERNVSNLDIVFLVTSDHGYAKKKKKMRRLGKRVVVIGEEKTPLSLRSACSEFVEI